MKAVQFVGPSYNLATRKADVQRTINMFPQKVESGSGKSEYILQSVPGLELYAESSASGYSQVLGMIASEAVSGIYAVLPGHFALIGSGSVSSLGVLTAGTHNLLAAGRSHIVISTGAAAYSYNFDTTVFAQIADADLYTFPSWVAYLGGRFIFGNADTDEFQWTAIDDPTDIDALDFATAESSPDGVRRGIVYRDELWLLGSRSSTEVWRVSDSADAAFERNTSVSINVGCLAMESAAVLDNALFWVGGDTNGGRTVYAAQGYQPRRVSTHAVEELLALSSDISLARAYTFQRNGHAFYCLNVPDVDATLCYDTNTGLWHERTDFLSGDHVQFRVTHHAVSFEGESIYGGSLVDHPTLSDRAVFYTASDSVYDVEGDTLCRERISPHFANGSNDYVFYSRLRLDCSTGTEGTTEEDSAPVVQLSYSDDGGLTFGSTLQRSLGATGVRPQKVEWNRLGRARDRVWKVRCTDRVKFDIIGADISAEAGTS